MPSGINPKRAGGGSPLGQFTSQMLSVTVPIPAKATHVFAELLAPGGSATVSGSGSAVGGGGGGGDAILSISSSDVLAVDASQGPYNLLKNGEVVLSVTVGGAANTGASIPAGAGGSGKYPGTAGAASVSSGKGGGRLAGNTATVATSQPRVGGAGSGVAVQVSSATSVSASNGLAVFTFFESYKDALAFANACYNGAWVP